MSSKKKFEAFKENLIEENERKYGAEIRQKYGDDAINESNRKLADMTEEQWEKQENLSKEIAALLKQETPKGNPSSEEAKRLCDLHRQWLCMFWKEGMYSKEAHSCLGESYVADERFKKYYDDIVPGGAVFLRDALKYQLNECHIQGGSATDAK